MKKGILLTIAAVTLAVGGGAYLLLDPSHEGESSRNEERATSTRPAPWTGLSPREVAEKFTEADTTAERLKWVRDPDRVAPLVEAFYGEGPGAREKVVDVKPMGAAQTPEFAYQRFQAKLDDGASRLVAVVLSEDGAKVDFDCYARHGSASWPDLLAGKATVMRLFVKPGTYYNYTFSDDQAWRGFVASSPDLEEPFFVYVRRGSEEAKRLAAVRTPRPTRVTVGLRSLKGSHQQRQFEVKAVHAQGWVVADPQAPSGDDPES